MGDHRDGELARLARRTEDIEPGSGFTDRVMSAVHEAARSRGRSEAPLKAAGAEPLERVAALTATIEPRDGFTDAVMESVRAVHDAPRKSVRVGWVEGVGRTGVRAILVAAAVAAASMLYSSYAERSFDASVVAAGVDEAGE
jgi:hypothetical protein